MKKLLIICLLAVFTFSLAGSISAAAPTVRQLTTKEAIFNQFKQDLGSRSNLLNSANPRRTGSYGLYEYFITYSAANATPGNGMMTPTAFNAVTVMPTGGTVAVPLMSLSVADRLNWFKSQFILNPYKVGTSGERIFDTYDKAGVERAIKARLTDPLVPAFEKLATTKAGVKIIKDAFNKTLSGRTVVAVVADPSVTPPILAVPPFKSLVTLRKDAITTCEGTYRTDLRNQALANPDYTELGRYIANLSLLQAKDSCVNTAWTGFYTAGLTLPTGQTGPTNVAAAIEVARIAYAALPGYAILASTISSINTAWVWL